MKNDMHKAALIVPRLTADTNVNLTTILRLATDAVKAGVSLILLPEAALTGLINNDDPIHDLSLGQEVPGPITDILGSFCLRHSVWMGIGMLERKDNQLFDSAILLDQNGAIALKHRRNQPQWHGRKADPSVYRQGSHIAKAETPFGSVAFLICGDLFDDSILSRFKELKSDWLLFPFARSFTDGTSNQQRWETEELPLYRQRVKMAGAPALMVNYLADNNLPWDNSFGGAFFVSAHGEVMASHPLGREGILTFNLEIHRLDRNDDAT